MISHIEDYFSKGCGRCERFETADCSVQLWHQNLVQLRELCLAAGLVETVKWGHPCYMHAEQNIAIIGAHRKDCRLSFFNPSLLQDPEKLLQKQGPNTQHAGMLSFTKAGQVAQMKAVIQAYLKEAMGYAEQGIKPVKVATELELPEELVDALDADPEMAEAFHALTPGRQKSYVINLNSAKKAETRIARIEKFRAKILAGKGAMER